MNIKEAMMDSVGSRLDLREVGTRYDHYMELKEVFMTGIEVVKGMRFANVGDEQTKVKLEHAVDLIDRRLKYLSNYDDKIFTVGKEVKSAGIHKTLQLTEGTSDVIKEDSNTTNTPSVKNDPPDGPPAVA